MKLDKLNTQNYNSKYSGSKIMKKLSITKNNDSDVYKSQREMFVEHSKRTAKRKYKRIIQKPKRIRKLIKLSSRRDKDFHKTLHECVVKGEWLRLEELLAKKTIDLERPDEVYFIYCMLFMNIEPKYSTQHSSSKRTTWRIKYSYEFTDINFFRNIGEKRRSSQYTE